MFSSQHRKARLLFELADLLLTVLAFYAAYATRLQTSLEREFFIVGSQQALILGFCLVAAVALGRWLSVYEKLDSGQPSAILRDALAQSSYLALGLLVFEYLLRLDLSRLFVGLFIVFTFFFLSLFRLLSGPLIGWVRNKSGALRYILIVGSGPRARQFVETIEAAHDRGLRVKGLVDWTARDEITPLLRQHVIDEIVFAVDAAVLPELEEVLLLCDEEGVRTRIAVDFFPHVNSDLHLERLGVTPLLTYSATPDDEVRLLFKRFIDVIIATCALILLSPLMLLLVILIRLGSKGPAVFRQERCGLNGRRFVCYKFRSMRDTPDDVEPCVQTGRTVAAKISPDDPRVTPLGRWMRKFSFDELPQFYNVLRGDMSLVGPRPAIPSEVEQYQRWQRRRLRMRPGITCLWALNGRDRLDFETWMRMDMEYIDRWSLGLDAKIMLQTIPQVLLGRDAN